MEIVIFAHPYFLKSESMPRFASMLEEGFTALGHHVTVARPRPVMHALLGKSRISKWAGYFDQYVLFPFVVKYLDLTKSRNAVFVLADQALGPWARYIKRHRIVAHCLDLLAMKSALGVYPENPVKFTGRIYQRYLRWGYQVCDHFICISKRTATDLVQYGNIPASKISVVYLGLNYPYQPVSESLASDRFKTAGIRVQPGRYLLFVGGSQWYKNRLGLLKMYVRYAELARQPLPLVCVSPGPDDDLKQVLAQLPGTGNVFFHQKVDAPVLEALYSTAAVTLFPSHAEGYGWPIIEAQACGSMILTTDDSPMNEIAGNSAFFIRRMDAATSPDEWAKAFVIQIEQILAIDKQKKESTRAAGLYWSNRFASGEDFDSYLRLYEG